MPLAHVVELRDLDGHRGAEIARTLDISEASVRRRIHRGLDELRASATGPARGK